jgi:hypothetical protein
MKRVGLQYVVRQEGESFGVSCPAVWLHDKEIEPLEAASPEQPRRIGAVSGNQVK